MTPSHFITAAIALGSLALQAMDAEDATPESCYPTLDLLSDLFMQDPDSALALSTIDQARHQLDRDHEVARAMIQSMVNYWTRSKPSDHVLLSLITNSEREVIPRIRIADLLSSSADAPLTIEVDASLTVELYAFLAPPDPTAEQIQEATAWILAQATPMANAEGEPIGVEIPCIVCGGPDDHGGDCLVHAAAKMVPARADIEGIGGLA